jgi:hypothetical protein
VTGKKELSKKNHYGIIYSEIFWGVVLWQPSMEKRGCWGNILP